MQIDKNRISNLIDEAENARKYSYSRYSNFSVGAALLCLDGTIFTGCNIENVSFSATVCAERTAFFKAISQRHTEFLAIAIVGGKQNEKIIDFSPPCGICLQVMLEFCNPNSFSIILYNGKNYKIVKLKELLPMGFSVNLRNN